MHKQKQGSGLPRAGARLREIGPYGMGQGRVLSCLVLLGVGLAGVSSGDYPTPAGAGFHHCVLIYDRDERSASDLAPYVAELVDGKPRAWLFDAFLFLMTRTPSGRRTTGGASRREDWQYHLDRWFEEGRDLGALDQALEDAKPYLGNPPGKRQVILSIPRPGRQVSEIGERDEPVEGSAAGAGIEKALRWYVEEACRRFEAAGYANLELWGFYWMHETIPAADEAFARMATAVVHEGGRKMLWIPWFRAAGWDGWRAAGIDVAIMQPNYAFFSKHAGTVRRDRLARNARLARGAGLGVEIELPMFRDHPATEYYFRRYLADGAKARFGYQAGATAYYLGRDNLERLCNSDRPWQRELYTALAAYVRGETIPDPDPPTLWRENGDPMPLLSDGKHDRACGVRTIVGVPNEPASLSAVDVYRQTLSSGERWQGCVVADTRQTADAPWKPTGWALSHGTASIAAEGTVLTIPLRGRAQSVRLSFRPVDGAEPAPVREVVLDRCPPGENRRREMHLARDASYTVTPAYEALYGDRGGELTDGLVPAGGFASGDTVGWQGREAEIRFDLGRVETIDQVEICVDGGGYAAVDWPASGVLKTAVNRFPPSGTSGAGSLPEEFAWLGAPALVIDRQTPPTEASGRLVFRPAVPHIGRYVTVDLKARGWLMVSEVRIWSGAKNVARGREYALRPAPSPKRTFPYPDDGAKLTDGWIAEDFSRPILTGWYDDEPRTFTIRLPFRQPVRRVAVWTLAGGQHGIRAPRSVRVAVSPDGTTWRSLDEAVPAAGGSRQGPLYALPYESTFPATSAVAVRVRVVRGAGWAMLSEVTVN